MKRFVFLIVGSALTATAVGAETPQTRVTAPDFAAALMNDVISPQVQQLQTKAGVLNQSLSALCQKGDANKLKNAQDAYQDTFNAWQQIRIAPIGPNKQLNNVRIFDTPAQSLDELVRQSKSIPNHAMSAGQAHDYGLQLGDGYIGLPVIATVLFSDTANLTTNQQELLCRNLDLQSKIISRQVTILGYEWQGLIRGAAYDLSYPAQFMNNYMKALISGSQELAKRAVQDHQKQLAASEFTANIAGITSLITGGSGIGLDDYLLSRQHKAQWKKTQQKLKQLQRSGVQFSQNSNPGNAKQIALTAHALSEALSADVATALNLRVNE